jgi:putative endonuclease
MALNRRAALLGKNGEQAAADFLQAQGYQIIDRNWRIKEGELDLIAISREKTIVFIEVKTRSSNEFGEPLESISPNKLYRLQRLALAWLATHQRLGAPYRIDVAGVMIGRSGELSIDYRKDVS